MLAWLQFSANFGSWSALTFWMVMISVVLTLGFTVVVFFGGLSDLRFLLRAIDEEAVDAATVKDDGRALPPDEMSEAVREP